MFVTLLNLSICKLCTYKLLLLLLLFVVVVVVVIVGPPTTCNNIFDKDGKFTQWDLCSGLEGGFIF